MYGKILRLNPEDGSAPADNPFVGDPGALPQIYAYGFRNPFLVFLGVLGAMILTGVLLFSLLAQAGLAPVLVTGGPGV